jgi:hypothetical protein
MAMTSSNRMTGSLQTLTLVLTSGSDGTLSETTPHVIAGKLVGVYVKPGSGADQPSNGFSLTLTDLHSREVLVSNGLGLPNDTDSNFVPLVSGQCLYCDSSVVVALSGAGVAKKVTVIIHAVQAS